MRVTPLNSRQHLPPVHPARSGKPHRRLKHLLRAALALLLTILFLSWWTVLRIDIGDHWPPPADAVTAAEAQAATERFVARANPKRDDIAIDYAPSTASDVSMFDGAPQFFPAMLSDIQEAETSIHITMFAFTPGDWGETFSNALIERSKAGVEVRLTVDAHGSKVRGSSQDMFLKMALAGVHVVANDVFPLQAKGEIPERALTIRQDEAGQVDHRKLLVIDGKVAWVGGAGFEDHFFTGQYHDVFVRVQGDVVRQLQMAFLTGFRGYGGVLPEGDGALARYFPAPEDGGSIRVTVLQNVPGGFRPATQATQQLLDDAVGRIDILNPYLSDPGIIESLIAAAKRGVDVRVVVPGTSNNPPADSAMEYRYPALIAAGVKIREYPEIIHAKVLIADNALISGSLNYDAWALYRNMELSLLFEDDDVSDMARKTFIEPAWARSSAADVPDSTVDKARNWFWDKLTYFL